MGFPCGIVGLPNVGKSTIFNALTSAKAEAANYPFCTIDPNTGIVKVPDPRLAQIQKYIPTDKLVPASMTFVDIAGLVKGASKGEGLGKPILGSYPRDQCDRSRRSLFLGSERHSRRGSVDPLRDISVIDTELILADLETVNKRYNSHGENRSHRRQKSRGRDGRSRAREEPRSNPESPRARLRLVRRRAAVDSRFSPDHR